MAKENERASAPLFLGIECGGTRTQVALADNEATVLWQDRFGPANLRLVTDAQLIRHFQVIGNALAKPTAIAIGMAGARTDNDRKRIRSAAANVWPGVPCHATNDLETALEAADDLPEPSRGDSDFSKIEGTNARFANPRSIDRREKIPRVLILSGTGSCCFGRSGDGRTIRIGGWGHLLGDKGSGYEIGLRALKAVAYYHDRDGEWSVLGRRILRELQLNQPDDLVDWVQKAGKDDVAALAVEVFYAASQRDKIASDILKGAAHSLAQDAFSCARRLAKSGARVHFIFAGGVLLKQPGFAAKVARLLRDSWTNAVVTKLRRESVWGAVRLAEKLVLDRTNRNPPIVAKPKETVRELPALGSLNLSPTEQRNPRSMNLDRLSVADGITLMLGEDQKIPRAILAQRNALESAVKFIARAFKQGGRLFYVGAGTSGRLGVLDASECPPTFGSPPESVQGIIAGGSRALWEAVEGAEDDQAAGAAALHYRGVNSRDVVVGIAASGRTPFVWGALREAGRRGAKTILLCFNPKLEIPRHSRPALVIAPDVGPEILTGSTRLKSGTATKLILNIFTTLAMVRTGRVISNLMSDLDPTNIKLRARAVRIVQDLTGCDPGVAKQALTSSGWVVRKAWLRLQSKRRVPTTVIE